MDKQIEHALRQAAHEQMALDSDVVLMAPFADLVAQVEAQKLSAHEAVRAMRERKPVLFKERDWSKVAQDPDAFDERERQFREGLRRTPRVGPNEWRFLDAARLSAEELEALERSVNGKTSSYDRALLTRALGRQKAENSAAAAE